MPALLFGIVQEARDMLLCEIKLSGAFGDHDKLADTVADLVCHKCDAEAPILPPSRPARAVKRGLLVVEPWHQALLPVTEER